MTQYNARSIFVVTRYVICHVTYICEKIARNNDALKQNRRNVTLLREHNVTCKRAFPPLTIDMIDIKIMKIATNTSVPP